MLRISTSLFLIVILIQSFAFSFERQPLQTWSCFDKNNLLNPKFKDLKSVEINDHENQRNVDLKVCSEDGQCEILSYNLNDWNQTPSQLRGWSKDRTYRYDFAFEFNSRAELKKMEIITSYIHFDGEDICSGTVAD